MKMIEIKIEGATNNQISINPLAIQELIITSRGNQYYVQLITVSGRAYILVDDSNKNVFDTLAEAKILRDAVVTKINKELNGEGA